MIFLFILFLLISIKFLSPFIRLTGCRDISSFLRSRILWDNISCDQKSSKFILESNVPKIIHFTENISCDNIFLLGAMLPRSHIFRHPVRLLKKINLFIHSTRSFTSSLSRLKRSTSVRTQRSRSPYKSTNLPFELPSLHHRGLTWNAQWKILVMRIGSLGLFLARYDFRDFPLPTVML